MWIPKFIIKNKVEISFNKVKAHDGIRGNEVVADSLTILGCQNKIALNTKMCENRLIVKSSRNFMKKINKLRPEAEFLPLGF
ncbi:unnamed protein product [Rhizophagus irregularis]|nr:unnamed protein product [Rhizophagus irregularis]